MREGISIRRVRTHTEYEQVENLQRTIWGMQDDSAMVPLHLLITAQNKGGLILGAFTPQRKMVGFVFGFIGSTTDERAGWMGTPFFHCSHMMGVLSEYRGRSLGYELKSAQRRFLLAQGCKLITWTFDPLLSINAWLNIERLGGIARKYIPNLYGEIREALNAGLPTDRFELEWWIGSHRVRDRLRRSHTRCGLDLSQTENAERINTTETRHDGLRAPTGFEKNAIAARLLVEIPGDFQGMRGVDLALAREWRTHVREVFEWAFGEKYVVTGIASEGEDDLRRSYYVLTRMDVARLARSNDAD